MSPIRETCSACSHPISPAARFCGHCGTALDSRCEGCETVLSEGANFCGQCGRATATPQAEAAPPDAAPSAAPAPTTLRAATAPATGATGDKPYGGARRPTEAGERRQLTVVFCDLVDSTELAQRLDPEELREVIRSFQGVCTEVVKRFDGHIAQLLGDGVLVYFGFPRAHEDDAERALRAGLEIQRLLPEGLRAQGIEARIGVHTGPVVVRQVGASEHREMLALGATTNLAARIQELAAPGSVALSEETHRLTRGAFVMRSLGTTHLEGIHEPVQILEVERSLGVRSKLAAPGALTPMIGREREIGQLLDRFEQAGEGYGQVVLLSGEAGIGKSRLLRSLREVLGERPHTWLELQCSSYFAGSAFQPVRDLVEAWFDLDSVTEPGERARRVDAAVAELATLDPDDVVPYLLALLELPGSTRHPLPQLSPEVQRARTLEALAKLVLAMARHRTLVISAEDLHWADPSTIEYLGLLVQEAATSSVLLVMTHRPEFPVPWMRSHVTPVALSRLPERLTRTMIEESAGGRQLPEPVMQRIAERADGVPLFIEELSRAVVDSGIVVERANRYELTGGPGDLAIPTTLQGSLMARLDRLSAAKRVAQLAATLGREFSYALIEAVAEIETPALRTALGELVEAEILYQKGIPPDASYTFKHALLQDTAYQSQLRSQRRERHARVAAALEEHFPERVAAELEVIAHHSAEGGLHEQAVAHFERAAQRSVAQFANTEAIGYFALAIDTLMQQPENPERTQHEIGLRLARTFALVPLHDYDHPEVLASVHRVEELSDALGSGPLQIPALLGLAQFYQMRGSLGLARDFGRALLGTAEELHIPLLQAVGHLVIGGATVNDAPIAEALRHLEQALAIAEANELPGPTSVLEPDLTAMIQTILGIALALAGRADASTRVAEQGCHRAEALDHPATLASVCANATVAFTLLEDAERAERWSRVALDSAEGRGFHSAVTPAQVAHGWARTVLGDPAGADEAAAGIAFARNKGTRGGLEHFLASAADAYRRSGDFGQAHELLDAAVSDCETHGFAICYAGRIDRLRALVQRDEGRLVEARATLERSVDWLERQGAGLELLMARTAQLRIAREQADASAAQHLADILAGLLGGFAEGHESVALRDARAALAEAFAA